MEIKEIFREKDYHDAFKYAISNGLIINEIEADNDGRRFQIDNPPDPSIKELSEIEIEELRTWFDNYYAQHEQKLRRLHTLGRTTDTGKNAYTELLNLYAEAETKRARIQVLEANCE